MTQRPAKRAVGVMAGSLSQTLHSPQWRAAADNDERAWLLLSGLCAALHPLGPFTVPSQAQLHALVRRLDRDARIRREFTGHNHDALAARYRLTARQIRRILGTRGWRPRK